MLVATLQDIQKKRVDTGDDVVMLHISQWKEHSPSRLKTIQASAHWRMGDIIASHH